VSKCDLCVSLQKRETHVQQEAAPECDLRVSLLKRKSLVQQCEVRVQPPEAKFKCELLSPHPHGFEASSSDTPATDLRDYFARKRSTPQITPQYHYEQFISAVLSDCHCNFQMTKPSIFSLLSNASNSNSAKKRQSRRKKSFSGTKYPKMTSNIVGASTTQSKSKRKQLAFSSE